MQRLVDLECRSSEGLSFQILEIGSWAGGSAISWAEAIARFNGRRGSVLCVDPWVPYLEPQIGRAPIYGAMSRALASGEVLQLFLHNIRTSGYEDFVRMLRGTSDEMLPLLKPEAFDLVFIDGDHTNTQVLRDLQNAAPLVRRGGILCGDDLELQLSETTPAFVEQNLGIDYLSDPHTQRSFHPGVTWAIAAFFGEVSVWEGFWAMRKESEGWSRIPADAFSAEEIEIPAHLRRTQ